MGEDGTITYEIIFDILRRERSHTELQPLESDFSSKVSSYISEKKKVLEGDTSNPFASTDMSNISEQLNSVRKTLKTLFELRNKKIIKLAMLQSRTGSDVIDLSVMTPQEKAYFSDLLKVMNDHRSAILTQLLDGSEVSSTPNVAPSPSPQTTDPEPAVQAQPEPSPQPSTAGTPSTAEADESTVKIKFLHPVPKFVGKNLEVFGPYESGESAELPENIANILVRKKRGVLENAQEATPSA